MGVGRGSPATQGWRQESKVEGGEDEAVDRVYIF